jgi:predicted HicB family RNase H-like nuclease
VPDTVPKEEKTERRTGRRRRTPTPAVVVERYTYRVAWSEEDQEFVGLCAEFPSLSWLDRSQADALAGIVRLVRGVVTDMRRAQEAIPIPMALQPYRGEFRVRIPPHLHRRLAVEAAEAKVSLNRLVSAKLAQS